MEKSWVLGHWWGERVIYFQQLLWVPCSAHTAWSLTPAWYSRCRVQTALLSTLALRLGFSKIGFSIVHWKLLVSQLFFLHRLWGMALGSSAEVSFLVSSRISKALPTKNFRLIFFNCNVHIVDLIQNAGGVLHPLCWFDFKFVSLGSLFVLIVEESLDMLVLWLFIFQKIEFRLTFVPLQVSSFFVEGQRIKASLLVLEGHSPHLLTFGEGNFHLLTQVKYYMEKTKLSFPTSPQKTNMEDE